MTASKRVTVPTLQQMKEQGEKIAMLTAYDFTFAQLMDQAGMDAILVGDSLGMVVQGHETTLPVTMDEMVYHTRLVRRGVQRALLVADLPFMSYQVNIEEALHNAGRLMKEAQADAVKLEGGRKHAAAIRAMVEAGIPVMGHVGLGPQSIKQLGRHKVQGKTSREIDGLITDAMAVQEAGAFSLVIEAVPWQVAQALTQALQIPTIGIGAGEHCDGQVLVYADMLGLFTSFQPHFVRRFAQLGEQASKAFADYRQAVRDGSFPSRDESYSTGEKELAALRQRMGSS